VYESVIEDGAYQALCGSYEEYSKNSLVEVCGVKEVSAEGIDGQSQEKDGTQQMSPDVAGLVV